MMIKFAMFIALIGHILCGVADCLLSYSKRGRLNLKDITDADKMADMFEDMPLSFPLASMLLGTFAITMFGFLPVWACVFNTLVVMIILAPTKLPAKGNIAGAVMYLGLLILI